MRRKNRGGYTLVLFVLLLWAMFGLAALVIDFGLARVTQQRMQDATDAAALEGLRYAESAQGKEKAQSIATANFLHEIGESVPEYNQAEIVFSGGLGGEDLLASQLIEDPTGRRWVPYPRTNDSSADLYYNDEKTEFTAHLIRDGQTPTDANNFGPRSPYLFARASVRPSEGVIGIPLRSESQATLQPVTTLASSTTLTGSPEVRYAVDIATVDADPSAPWVYEELTGNTSDFTYRIADELPFERTLIDGTPEEDGYVVFYQSVPSAEEGEPNDQRVVGFGYWSDDSQQQQDSLRGPAHFSTAKPQPIVKSWTQEGEAARNAFQTKFDYLKSNNYLLKAPVLAPSPTPYP
ncbi:TadE/TadG family type IV pilus assembly protein [Blastopirellula retiformator]|uniref:Putative Flp pilus-assembly TadG-like N-terminal domain-containing protein n=1 Tax=Blastopirellula retiformator TaxID=2527970 RepID=A0A5C5V9L5_9BACT|nr:TadE/TadG family type IV pilus assembly protein [Blastopirellula retiformator]TWT34613.1 hypothetical protein Enr8_20260 [Blastopirellula retiformator]